MLATRSEARRKTTGCAGETSRAQETATRLRQEAHESVADMAAPGGAHETRLRLSQEKDGADACGGYIKGADGENMFSRGGTWDIRDLREEETG